MRVDMWTDVACPHCYYSSRNLVTVVGQTTRPDPPHFCHGRRKEVCQRWSAGDAGELKRRGGLFEDPQSSRV
jgi:hypothetical protein